MSDKTIFHSLLIFGGDPSLRRTETEVFIAADHGFERQDVILIQAEGKSIGIDKIRELKEWLSLKPSKGTRKTAVIFEASEMTVEAQNSLLKTLEEPPLGTIIILTAPNKQSLLPTIVSRCFTKELKTSGTKKEGWLKEDGQSLASIRYVLSLNISDKLDLIEDNTKKIANREEILPLIDGWIGQIREDIIKDVSSKNGHLKNKINIIDQLIGTKGIISETNASIRLLIESLLLKLSWQ